MDNLLEIFSKRWKDQILPDVPEPKPNFIASILHRILSLEIESAMIIWKII